MKCFTVSAKKKLGNYSYDLPLTYPLLKTLAKIFNSLELFNSKMLPNTNQLILRLLGICIDLSNWQRSFEMGIHAKIVHVTCKQNILSTIKR
ncbi:hypothetical protein DYY65_05440 [Nitrososphaera sp. AFS]|nr:hypothetical protein [Nitrososphaera sp. AFS]